MFHEIYYASIFSKYQRKLKNICYIWTTWYESISTSMCLISDIDENESGIFKKNALIKKNNYAIKKIPFSLIYNFFLWKEY